MRRWFAGITGWVPVGYLYRHKFENETTATLQAILRNIEHIRMDHRAISMEKAGYQQGRCLSRNLKANRLFRRAKAVA